MAGVQEKGGRLVVLDGMRGIAAYVVLIHHGLAQSPGPNPLHAGYLAVDFFFVLSGYVLSQAYDGQFARGLKFRNFAKARLLRLMPTMMVGSMLGALSFYTTFHDATIATILFVLAAFFVPMFGTAMGIFPLDGVQWSLFFELVANAGHGAGLWRCGVRPLAMLALIAFCIFAAGSWVHGSIAVGDTSETFLLGFPRAAFGYVTGMLLYRTRALFSSLPVHGETPILGLILTVLLASALGSWGAEMLAVLVMPPLVIVGATATTRFPSLCQYAGRLSYPVYAIQVPVLCFCAHVPRTYRLGIEMAIVTVGAVTIDLLLRWRRSRPARPNQLAANPKQMRRKSSVFGGSAKRAFCRRRAALPHYGSADADGRNGSHSDLSLMN